jgi:hypothetical protein
MWSASRPSRFTPGKDPVPIVQEAGWAPRAGLDVCEKSRPPLPGFDPRTVQPVELGVILIFFIDKFPEFLDWPSYMNLIMCSRKFVCKHIRPPPVFRLAPVVTTRRGNRLPSHPDTFVMTLVKFPQIERSSPWPRRATPQTSAVWTSCNSWQSMILFLLQIIFEGVVFGTLNCHLYVVVALDCLLILSSTVCL